MSQTPVPDSAPTRPETPVALKAVSARDALAELAKGMPDAKVQQLCRLARIVRDMRQVESRHLVALVEVVKEMSVVDLSQVADLARNLLRAGGHR